MEGCVEAFVAGRLNPSRCSALVALGAGPRGENPARSTRSHLANPMIYLQIESAVNRRILPLAISERAAVSDAVGALHPTGINRRDWKSI